MNTNTIVIVAVIVLVVAIAAILAWAWRRRRQSENLRRRFGPEYDRAIARHGDARAAEKKLADRARRVEKLNIRPLDPAQRNRFASDWQTVQTRFVDDPGGAVSTADVLVKQVMEARGYPVGNFEERAADLSVDHAAVIENYRVARDIALRNRRGEASTEDLRKAVVSYRALFEDLLGSERPELAEVRHG